MSGRTNACIPVVILYFTVGTDDTSGIVGIGGGMIWTNTGDFIKIGDLVAATWVASGVGDIGDGVALTELA